MNAQFYLTYIRHFFGQPGELARLAEGAEGGRKSCQRVRVGRGSNVKCVSVQLATGFKFLKVEPSPGRSESTWNAAATSFSASLRAAAIVLKGCNSYRISTKPCG